MRDREGTHARHCVEFVGLACSGKSTISQRVIRELLRRQLPVVGSGEASDRRLALTLACAPRYPLAWWRVVRRYVRDRAVRAQLLRRACTVAAEQVYWPERNAIPVLDEGWFQMLRSLRRASTGDLTLRSILAVEALDNLVPPLSRQVVLVEIDASTLVRRSAARDGRSRTRSEAEEAVKRVAYTLADVESLRDRWPDTRLWSVRNDDGADVERVAQDLAASLTDHWRTPG